MLIGQLTDHPLPLLYKQVQTVYWGGGLLYYHRVREPNVLLSLQLCPVASRLLSKPPLRCVYVFVCVCGGGGGVLVFRKYYMYADCLFFYQQLVSTLCFVFTERTDKIPMNSIKTVVSEPIDDHEEYHIMVGVYNNNNNNNLFYSTVYKFKFVTTIAMPLEK